jgi:hypothetical protein
MSAKLVAVPGSSNLLIGIGGARKQHQTGDDKRDAVH